MILITCANGKTGRSIINEFKTRKINFIALVKSKKSYDFLKSDGVKNVIVADMSDLSKVKNQLLNVNTVYFISPNFSENDEIFFKNILSILDKKKKKKIVLHSVIHPHIKKLPHHWSKLKLETMTMDLKFPWVILQPTMYMQNILGQFELIIKNSEICMPVPLDKKLMMVDLRDVAKIAVRACISNDLDYGIFELCGDYISLQEQADIISKIRNIEIIPLEIDIDESKKKLKIPFSGEYGQNTYSKMFKYYSKNGLRGNSKVLNFLLDKNSFSFHDFANEFFK